MLIDIIFVLGIAYLIQYRLNIKKAAEMSYDSLYPKVLPIKVKGTFFHTKRFVVIENQEHLNQVEALLSEQGIKENS